MELPMGHCRPAVLFDLDGTLLPMEMKDFEHAYFRSLCTCFPELEPKLLVSSVWAGTKAMVKNAGQQTNREAFAAVFTRESGMDFWENEPRFEEYYRTRFADCRAVCEITDDSRRLVETLREKGYLVAIATNPFFPETATWARLRWLGLDPESFPLVTTYENCHSAKPNLYYYKEVLANLGLRGEDCLMIGNDVEEDGCATALGLEVFLIDDHLLNAKDLPAGHIPQGSMKEFLAWADSLPGRA